VSSLGRGDGLKICSPRALPIASVGRRRVEMGCPGELVILLPQGS